MRIEDGTGNGYEVAVTAENYLRTDTIAKSLQHHISSSHSNAFQVSADLAIGTSLQNLLLITNDGDKDLVISFMRVMSIGAAAASEDAYFSILGGGAYVSGGTEITPVNMNIGQSNVAVATVYDGSVAIVDDGNFVEFDRNYEANSMQTYLKDGSLILKRGASLSVAHKGSTVAGNAYCRVSFYFVDPSL